MSSDKNRKDAGMNREQINSADNKYSYINNPTRVERIQISKEESAVKQKGSGKTPSYPAPNDIIARSMMNQEDMSCTKSEAKPARIRKDLYNNEVGTKLPGIKPSKKTKQISEETAQIHRNIILNQSATTEIERKGDLRGFSPQKRGSFLMANVSPLDDMLGPEFDESEGNKKTS